MKLRFKATAKMRQYNGAFTARDGEVSPDLSEKEATRLCNSWPENFAPLEPAKPKTERKAFKPPKDKMIGRGKTK
jgi:hypothetical protein